MSNFIPNSNTDIRYKIVYRVGFKRFNQLVTLGLIFIVPLAIAKIANK
ncbi:MAG: hypothetical protein ACRC1P_02825 [Cellulosilyticaceae bacterium]